MGKKRRGGGQCVPFSSFWGGEKGASTCAQGKIMPHVCPSQGWRKNLMLICRVHTGPRNIGTPCGDTGELATAQQGSIDFWNCGDASWGVIASFLLRSCTTHTLHGEQKSFLPFSHPHFPPPPRWINLESDALLLWLEHSRFEIFLEIRVAGMFPSRQVGPPNFSPLRPPRSLVPNCA